MSVQPAHAPGPADHARVMPGAPAQPRVAVLVVTWNRRADLERCLTAIASQSYPVAHLDVVVVDNASSDGSPDHLLTTWRPERVVTNDAQRPDRPAFSLGKGTQGRNAGGFRSLTLVRNRHNLGGCGGFNTAFLFVERTIATHRQESMVPEDPRAARAEPLEFVWLVDDDAEPARDCLEHLVLAAASDPAIGIVGSRMMDPTDRATTLESLVFFNPTDGMFGPPQPGHPREGEHAAWLALVGDAKGRHDTPAARAAMTGVRDVDCVAACSMLARWSMARRVGYWDARFFIAGDDADWCLRFLSAGHRVVCCLDAIVYHLPWSRKQTPSQDYYRRRNLLWTWQRTLPGPQLRRLARARIRLILRQAWNAAWRARALDAEILRRCAHDAATGRGGRLDLSSRRDSARAPTTERLAQVAPNHAPPTLVALCPTARAVRRALRLRAVLNRKGTPATWTLMAPPEGVSDRLAQRLAREGVAHVPYAHRAPSMLKRQLPFFLRPPAAWVIIDGRNDVPLVRPSRVIHVDSRDLANARLERGVPGARAAFVARWFWTWIRCRWYLARLRPTPFTGRFGTDSQSPRAAAPAPGPTGPSRTSASRRGGGEEIAW